MEKNNIDKDIENNINLCSQVEDLRDSLVKAYALCEELTALCIQKFNKIEIDDAMKKAYYKSLLLRYTDGPRN